MLIEQVEAMRTQTDSLSRQVLEAAGLSRATLHRWTARLRGGEAAVQPPGPKKVASLDLEGLMTEVRQMAHRRRRTFGTAQLYEAHRDEVSRRQLQKLVRIERCRIKAEKRARLKRITWHLPGMVWAMDSTRIPACRGLGAGRRAVELQQVQDLASRYKFEPFLASSLNGEQVAAHLERMIAVHGAPLILKRDRGSNLRDQAVQAVMEKHLIIPLDSPRQYPRYNGAVERAQREMKEALENHSVECGEPSSLAGLALSNHIAAAHQLNHRPRPCLGGKTACAVFEAGREAMKAYTRRKRKEGIEWIKQKALDILQTEGSSGINAQDAAWRRAVESWLHQNGLITVEVDGKVLPYFP